MSIPLLPAVPAAAVSVPLPRSGWPPADALTFAATALAALARPGPASISMPPVSRLSVPSCVSTRDFVCGAMADLVIVATRLLLLTLAMLISYIVEMPCIPLIVLLSVVSVVSVPLVVRRFTVSPTASDGPAPLATAAPSVTPERSVVPVVVSVSSVEPLVTVLGR